MGFLSQVPLSARFLLYRAVRGGLAPLRQGRASATQQNVYSPCGLAGQTTAERIYHCHKIFAHGGGWIFSSHPRANLYKKGSPGVEKKKMLRQQMRRTTVNGQSIFVKRYNGSSFPTIQRASRVFCRLCQFLFQSPASSFRQG